MEHKIIEDICKNIESPFKTKTTTKQKIKIVRPPDQRIYQIQKASVFYR